MESKSMYYNDHHHAQRKRSLLFRMALCPIAIYILFIAPVLAALIRSAVSRQREFLADADAALLTRYPEGLMRALAKIGGAGSGVAGANPAFAHFYFADPSAKASLFSGNLLATHPPITERIERLVQFQGPSAVAGLEDAVRHGKKYSQNLGSIAAAERDLNPGVRDELSALNQGNVMGRVYRVLSQSPVPIYDLSNTTSCRVAMVKPGSLLVVFDDPGKMRQVNTADQTFGYMERSVKLVPVNNMIPAEVYDPKLRAAAEAALPPLSDAPSAASLATGGLTRSQLYLALGFGGAVFAGMLILLVAFGRK
jgi:hypothetical protein